MKTIALCAAVAACAFGAQALTVSKVPEGKVCAFSFTYDDGVATHYTHAFKAHLKYGLPGTFLIVTDRVEDDADPNRAHKNCSWKELKEMSDQGMEIASHTKSHRNMRDLESAGLTREMTKGKKRDELFAMREPNWPTVWAEVDEARKAIEAHTGKPVRTTAFAGNACPDWTGRIRTEARTCVRVGNIRIATGRGDSTEKYLKQLEDKVMKTNTVSCVMVHGLGTKTPGDGWNPPDAYETYESLLKLVAERQDRIHVGTYADNDTYESLAKKAKLQQDKQTGECKLVYTGKDEPKSTTIWLRVSPNEKVSVNGVPAVPNAYGAILAHFGDVLKVD